MIAIYEATMLLAVALIAIVITIFVLAVTLLGRALKAARKEEEEIQRKKKEDWDSTFKQLQDDLVAAKQKGADDTIDNIYRSIAEHERKKKDRGKEQKHAKRFEQLGVKGGVLYPAAFFLATLALAGVASQLSSAPDFNWASFSFWASSVIALFFGLQRIYQVLMVIQEVAITSEEAQFQREAAALKTAMQQYDEERRPALELQFMDEQPPFIFKPGIEREIRFRVLLTQGDVGRRAEVWFLAQPQFAFPGVNTWSQEKDYDPLPNALTTIIEMGNILQGTYMPGKLKIKPPAQKDEYQLLCTLYCEGFRSELLKFVVKVAD